MLDICTQTVWRYQSHRKTLLVSENVSKDIMQDSCGFCFLATSMMHRWIDYAENSMDEAVSLDRKLVDFFGTLKATLREN